MAENSYWDYLPSAVQMLFGHVPSTAVQAPKARPRPVAPAQTPDQDSGMSLADLVRGRKPVQKTGDWQARLEGAKSATVVGTLADAAGGALGNFLGRHPTVGDPLAYLMSGGDSNAHFKPGTGSVGTDFENERQRSRAAADQAWKTNKAAYAEGYIPGFVASFGLPAGKIEKLTTPASRLAARIALGEGYGAVSGYADAEPGDAVDSAKRGLAVGSVVTPAVGAILDRALPALARKFGRTAADNMSTAIDPTAINSPAHFVDRANAEGLDFINSPHGSAYFNKHAPDIHKELTYRIDGGDPSVAADQIDRRVADSDAFEGIDRRTGVSNNPIEHLNDMPGVDGVPVDPMAPPTTHLDAPTFDPNEAAAQRDRLAQLGQPPESTAEGAPSSLTFDNGNVIPITERDTAGLQARMAEMDIDPSKLTAVPPGEYPPTLNPDNVTPTGEPQTPVAANDTAAPPSMVSNGYDNVTPPADAPVVTPSADNANLAAREPSGPQYVGSINTSSMDPETAAGVREAADQTGIYPTHRSRADTEAAGDAMGAGPGNIPSVGDVSATISAGDKVVTDQTSKLFETVGTHGKDSPETAQALEDWVNSFAPHSENVGETGRAMNILRKTRYNEKGEKVGDPEATKVLNENLANPETRDAALDAIESAPKGKDGKPDPKALATIASKLKKKTIGDFVSNVYYSAWLSDPASQSRNILGNTEKLLTDIGINGLTAIAGLPGKLSASGNRVFSREVVAQSYGAMRGALAGLKNLKAAYLRGAPLDQVGREGSPGVGGTLGNILEFGPRGMAAGDEFFRSVAFMSNMYRQATRDAIIANGEEGTTAFSSLFDDINDRVANPSNDTIKQSVEYAKEARFQNDPGFVSRGVESMLANKESDMLPTKGLKMATRLMLFPFNRTPANILREAARTSPAGVLSSRNWAAWKAGGPEAQKATMRVAFGSGVAGLVYDQASNGGITGQGPADYKKLAALKDSGWTPNSIKVGDHYIPYEGLGPISVMLSSVATAAERAKAGELDGKGVGSQMASASLGVADAAVHNGWMSSLADLFDAMGQSSDDQREKGVMAAIAGQAASPAQPGLARAVNQSFFDPYQRETKGANDPGAKGALEQAGNRIIAAWPGLSDSLPIHHDTLGNPVLNRRQGEGVGAFISPSVPVPIKSDPVVKAIAQVETDSGSKVVAPPAPTTIKIPGVDQPYRMNGKEYQTYQSIVGQYVRLNMEDFVKAKGWDQLSTADKASVIKDQFSDARKFARETMFPLPADADTPTESQPIPEAPEAPAASTSPATAAPDDGNTFTAGIPTSIRRTVKGNEAVGGVAHSDHLKGDAIDFLPAKGWTMKELHMAAVAYFGNTPGVTVLNEGDHVHVHIPGLNGSYYGKRGTQ